MFVDTHCHIFEPEFDHDRREAMRRAMDAGVGKFLLPAIDGDGYDRMTAFHDEWSDCTFQCMGLHPTSVTPDRDWKRDLETVGRCLHDCPKNAFHAVGEIGLDLHWTRETIRMQEEVLEAQLDWALELGLPVCIHTRDAWTEMMRIISSYRGRGLRGVFHAFSADAETAGRLLECGEFLFGIGGAVTYRNSPMAEFVSRFGLGHLVLETDCPYLTPVPHRGERNEPAYIPLIAEKIAELCGTGSSDVAFATTRSAEAMFNL